MAGMSAAHSGCSMVRSMGYDLGCGEDDYRYANAKPFGSGSFHPSDIGAYGTKGGTWVMPPAADYRTERHYGGMQPPADKITEDQLAWESTHHEPQPTHRRRAQDVWDRRVQRLSYEVVDRMEGDPQLSFGKAMEAVLTKAGSDDFTDDAYLVTDCIGLYIAPTLAELSVGATSYHGRPVYNRFSISQRLAAGAAQFAKTNGYADLEARFNDVAMHIKYITPSVVGI